MKTLIFAESKHFIDEIYESVSSLESEIIISTNWGGCAALLSAYHFSAVIINLRPSEYGGSLDLSLISFIKANYPSNNVLAIYDVKAFLSSPEDENKSCDRIPVALLKFKICLAVHVEKYQDSGWMKRLDTCQNSLNQLPGLIRFNLISLAAIYRCT